MTRMGPRPVAGSGLADALDLLTPPFAAAAGRDDVPLVAGRFAVQGPRRHPALLVRLQHSLARSAVLIRAEVGGTELPPVVFTAYTPAGSVLPLYVPELPAGTDGTGSFVVTVRVWQLDGPTTAGVAHDDAAVRAAAGGAPLANAAAAELVDGIVLDGLLSRLVYLSTLEKQRLLTVGREVAAARHVALARAAALDVHGADLAVPRLAGEADDAYRARLAIYSAWRLATPDGFAAALNGPGGPDDPNTGLPSTVGVRPRFRLVERAGQLAVAVRLVQVGGELPARDRFAALLTGGLLFDLDRPAATGLPTATRKRLDQVRKVLDDRLSRTGTPAPRYLTTLTATSLERAVRLLELLTTDGKLTLLRAWTKEADPRHELGLGVTVQQLTKARLDKALTAARKAQDAAAAGEPVDFPGADGEVPAELMAAVLGAVPRDTDDDPIGAWLFTAAGMATVTAPAAGSLYLSPLPSLGLVVEGPANLTAGQSGEFVARLRQDDSTGRHILVDEAWQRAQPPLAALGNNPQPLTPAELRTGLQKFADAGSTLPPVLSPLAALGLAPALPGELAARILESYDLDLLTGVRFDDPLTGIAADSEPGRKLRERMVARAEAFTAAGFHSVRVTQSTAGDGVLLLGALSVLPGGSNRPGEPPPAAYRWFLSQLPTARDDSAPLELAKGMGGRATVRANRPGLALLVCVAYVRRGLADPYEVRIELPDDEVLTLEQYGYVMNLLEHLCPLGIEINTFDLRRNHVSVDGAEPTFLSSQVSRSYTRYRRRRPGGADRHPDVEEPRS